MAKRIPNNRCIRSLDDSEDLISSTNDGSQPISQNVQDLANDIYKEFESLIKLYGNGFLHNLMPLVIRALENLDSLHLENSDLHIKSLVLSDDHKLLSISRYEDHELEMKKDYQRLHDLYTNLLRAYLEYVERVRSMFHKYKLDHQCLPHAPYLTDNTSFEVSSPTQTSDRSTGADHLNRLSEPCFDELSQGDLPDDDGHDMKSHDGSCTASQPQCGETLGSDFAGKLCFKLCCH
ncbi:unnamed protein product [Trichobilharzia regenti]|nr:unnamed protein product [Trichobilharzia regenti]